MVNLQTQSDLIEDNHSSAGYLCVNVLLMLTYLVVYNGTETAAPVNDTNNKVIFFCFFVNSN